MNWEYADLFDEKIEDDQNDRDGQGSLMDQYWKNQDTSIRVGSMGYRTRTTKAGDRLEAEVYPIFGRKKMGRLRQAKKNETPEKQQIQNDKRSRRRLILMLEANFRAEEDYHITLTYAEECANLERCQKDIRNFFGRIRRAREKKSLGELQYLYAIGHDENQRLHVHVIMNGGLDRDEIERIWGKGYANCLRLQEYGNGLQGIASYLYKQNDRQKKQRNRKYLRSWSGSRNLKQPKIRTSDTKMNNSRVKIVAFDFRNAAKETMEKVYPGYTYEQCEVYYSDLVDGVYIRCVMRKMPKEVKR